MMKIHVSVLGRGKRKGRIVMKLILAWLVLVGPVGSALATGATYRCADGTRAGAVFSDPGPAGTVRLTFAGKAGTVALPQAPSADGGRYADGSVPCVDGSVLARAFFTFCSIGRCSHVFGL
jgi:hypothetical protein